MTSELYDLIAIGAHPDDVEVGCGGVLIKLAELGARTGVIYLTLGEMGTGGTVEVRAQEAEAGAVIMQTTLLERLDLGDTRLVDSPENRDQVAELLRRYRPRAVLVPWPRAGNGMRQSHADHVACGQLVTNARYYATFGKLPVAGEPYQVPGLFYYFLPNDEAPSFIVDITDQFDGWIKSLEAHRSQFLNPDKPRYRDYFWHLETVARWYGSLIGCKYGQAFKSLEPLPVQNLFCLVRGGVPGVLCRGNPLRFDDK
jgi:bacillithiol biosynthesis deacetylase BshB1